MAAVALMLLGLLAGIFIYLRVAQDDDRDALHDRIIGGQTYATSDDPSARELQQLERLGGKAAVLTFKFNRWFWSLWSGRRLALTLVVVAAAVCALCFHMASLMEETAVE